MLYSGQQRYNSANWQVLSDPQKRAIYDQYGEKGLKDMTPPGSSGPSFGNGTAGAGQKGFNPRNADDISAEFFGANLFGFGSSGPGRSSRFHSDGGIFGSNDYIFLTYSEGTVPRNPRLRANCLAALRSSILDQQGR
ncbi:hypothetical protein DITRI_Ditri07aG0030400 [Diplodiscus trichospermus]